MEDKMNIGQFIRILKTYPLDQEIEIECPNGLLAEPVIYNYRKDIANWNKPLKYVISWRK
jgi:hypothetical protein